jgi:hypothetical protein
LEIDGRITEIKDIPALTAGYGDYKDKIIGLKYQFIPEGKYLPAIAIGFMDPHGTRLYPSQYLVLSKQIYPFDFTLGYGNGRFGKNPLPAQGEGIKLEMFSHPKEWLDDSQFFWGVQLAISEKIAFMFEYSPIKYHIQTRDPAQEKYFREPVSSKINYGLRLRPAKWFEIDVSYQRGDEIGVNVSLAYELGRPFIPIFDPIHREKKENKLDPLSERLSEALVYMGFSDIVIVHEQEDMWVEAQNDKYFYNAKAVKIMLDTVNGISPDTVGKVHIILKKNGVPLFEIAAERADVSDLYTEKLTTGEFLHLSSVRTNRKDILGLRGRNKRSFRFGIKPSFETFLNDPSGFFKYRLGAEGWVSYHPWKGASLVTGIAAYPLNNISTSNEPLSVPVRSDLVLYTQEKVALNRLMFDQIKKVTPEIFSKFSVGYLEIQYAGIDAELAMPVLEGRLLLGISGSAVKKRDPDDLFRLKEDDVKDIYTTAFFNTRLNIPEKEMAIDINAGRFLAGDYGARFTVYKYINGVTLKAWYTITDTSVFSDGFNRGYRDKGIGISIPMRFFRGTDSKKTYSFSLSPWTRDTGKDIAHYGKLFDFMGRNTKIFLDKDLRMSY